MKHRFVRLVCLTLACLLVSFASLADGMEIAQPIQGEQAYPQGAEQAAYVFRYAYPQFIAERETDHDINAYYQALCDDLREVIIPQSVEASAMYAEPGAPVNYTEIGYQLTANADDYVSVILTNKQFLGYSESESLSANVFARDGIYAGQPVALSQVMGLEQEGDELAEGSSYASRLVYKLVWQIIQEQQASKQRDYFEELTQEHLEMALNPETDFYIDMDGNLVFYVQVGMIAGEVEGVLVFPFAMAELLSAVKE